MVMATCPEATDAKMRADATIRFGTSACSLGWVLAGATGRGVCAILLGDEPESLAHELEGRFPDAACVESEDDDMARVMDCVVDLIEHPEDGFAQATDVRGTPFQRRVWEALCEIPAGETRTYGEIAHRLGDPGASRAVASACAANPIAVAIPCHRVVRTGGALAGYRWGTWRKARLLEQEKGAAIGPG